MIILDTNVVSELLRPQPSAAVEAWFAQCEPGRLRLSAVTVAELLYGIARLPTGRRRTALEQEATRLIERFAEEVLVFDVAVARWYAVIVATRELAGAPIGALDAQIAAIGRAHGAVLATRNTRDFEGTEVELVDPWLHGD